MQHRQHTAAQKTTGSLVADPCCRKMERLKEEPPEKMTSMREQENCISAVVV